MQNLSITVHWILRSPDQYRYLAFFSHTLLSNNNLGHHFCCMFKVCVFHIPWEFTHRTASVIVYNGWRSVHVWGSYCKQGTNLHFRSDAQYMCEALIVSKEQTWHFRSGARFDEHMSWMDEISWFYQVAVMIATQSLILGRIMLGGDTSSITCCIL